MVMFIIVVLAPVFITTLLITGFVQMGRKKSGYTKASYYASILLTVMGIIVIIHELGAHFTEEIFSLGILGTMLFAICTIGLRKKLRE